MSQIITTTDFQASLPSNISYSASMAASIVDAVNQYIETETHRCWGEIKTITESYDWRKTLWLRQMDVTEIASIQIGWPGQTLSTLSSGSYHFNSLGRVTIYWRTPGGQSPLQNDFVHVTYKYGTEDVPADLKAAALATALGLYNWSLAGGKEIVASSVGSYRIETINAKSSSTGDQKTPYNNAAEHHFRVIQSYKKQRV